MTARALAFLAGVALGSLATMYALILTGRPKPRLTVGSPVIYSGGES